MWIWVLDYIDGDGEGQEHFRTFSNVEKMEGFLIETLDNWQYGEYDEIADLTMEEIFKCTGLELTQTITRP